MASLNKSSYPLFWYFTLTFVYILLRRWRNSGRPTSVQLEFAYLGLSDWHFGVITRNLWWTSPIFHYCAFQELKPYKIYEILNCICLCWLGRVCLLWFDPTFFFAKVSLSEASHLYICRTTSSAPNSPKHIHTFLYFIPYPDFSGSRHWEEEGQIVEVQHNELIKYAASHSHRHVYQPKVKAYVKLEVTHTLTPSGLTENEARNRLLIYGPNVIEPTSHWTVVLDLIQTPDFVARISFLVAYTLDGPIWSLMVVLGFLIYLIQLFVHVWRSLSFYDRTTLKLPETMVWLWTNSSWTRISSRLLVPGDVISLEPGELCCDVLLFSGSVCVDECSMTGQVEPRWVWGSASIQRQQSDDCFIYGKTQILTTSDGNTGSKTCLALVISTGSGIRLNLLSNRVKRSNIRCLINNPVSWVIPLGFYWHVLWLSTWIFKAACFKNYPLFFSLGNILDAPFYHLFVYFRSKSACLSISEAIRPAPPQEETNELSMTLSHPGSIIDLDFSSDRFFSKCVCNSWRYVLSAAQINLLFLSCDVELEHHSVHLVRDVKGVRSFPPNNVRLETPIMKSLPQIVSLGLQAMQRQSGFAPGQGTPSKEEFQVLGHWETPSQDFKAFLVHRFDPDLKILYARTVDTDIGAIVQEGTLPPDIDKFIGNYRLDGFKVDLLLLTVVAQENLQHLKSLDVKGLINHLKAKKSLVFLCLCLFWLPVSPADMRPGGISSLKLLNCHPKLWSADRLSTPFIRYARNLGVYNDPEDVVLVFNKGEYTATCFACFLTRKQDCLCLKDRYISLEYTMDAICLIKGFEGDPEATLRLLPQIKVLGGFGVDRQAKLLEILESHGFTCGFETGIRPTAKLTESTLTFTRVQCLDNMKFSSFQLSGDHDYRQVSTVMVECTKALHFIHQVRMFLPIHTSLSLLFVAPPFFYLFRETLSFQIYQFFVILDYAIAPVLLYRITSSPDTKLRKRSFGVTRYKSNILFLASRVFLHLFFGICIFY